MTTLPRAMLTTIASDFPADFVTTEPSELAEYGKDWTKVYAPNAAAVAFPRSTNDVARLVKLAAANNVALVPSGGRTGLAGGAMATRGELVVSLAKMNAIDPIDFLGATVRVDAGAITEAVHHHTAPYGLTWPIDFASKGSSTIGGNIATNAGGVNVIRYGLTRQWVLGLTVVVANGDVLVLNGALEKNNTGLDLRQLFIGSEGTLGIVTEACLKLTRIPSKLDVMLFAVSDLKAVLTLFKDARSAKITLHAFEFFTRACLARVMRHRKVRAPLSHDASHYVLVEVENADTQTIESWTTSLFERDLVLDGTLAQHSAQAKELWTLREGISESLSSTGLPHKNDVALPIAELDAFCASFDRVFSERYPGWEICLFGHIGDGNLHINVMKPDGMDRDAFFTKTKDADSDLFAIVKAHHGSISAEHGIGLLKKDSLGFSRTPEEIAVYRAVKNALDPKNMMNPGKVIDA
jgi:FAD/FMN-containing dehydrogenase